MPTPEEIKRIKELHEKGYSQYKIAKELGISRMIIFNQFKLLGLKSTGKNRDRTKNATECHVNFTRDKRLELNNKFFKLISDSIDAGGLTPNDMRSLATTYGIMVDKREILEPVQADRNGIAAIHKFNELLSENGSKTAESETDNKHPRK